MKNYYSYKILLILGFYLCYFPNIKQIYLYIYGYIFKKQIIRINNNISGYEAIYKTYIKNQHVILINDIYFEFIDCLIIDNYSLSPNFEHQFSEIGEHNVIIYFKQKMNKTELMFYNVKDLVSISFTTQFFNSEINNIYGMFKSTINLIKVNFYINSYPKIVNASYAFQNCISLTSLDLVNIISNETIDISYILSNCSSLKSIDFSHLDTSSIKNMDGAFYNCSSLKIIDLSLVNISNTLSMNYMFAECSSLIEINASFFSFSNLKEAKYMFRNCFLLSFIELSILTSNKINKEGIFDGCESLNKTIYDVCIVGYWFGTNYGSLATYYALHQEVKKMGYSILMIDNPLSQSSPLNDSKCNPKKIGKSLYNISNFKPLNKVYEFNNECKSFLLGSDQLWKPILSRPFNQFFFLDFVFSNKKKIAYATSFGDSYSGTEEEKRISKINLKRFDKISVRDKLSLQITKEIFDLKNVSQVCDPTFICDYEEYEKLINRSKINLTTEYILAYVLDPTDEKGKRLEKLSVDKNILVLIILDERQLNWEENKKALNLTGKGNVKVAEKVDLNDFLKYFKNSKAVFTDSFHGTIFSIIFKKPFITLRNIVRGGERFFSLLIPLNLTYRLFENVNCINKNYDLYEYIDYNIPYKKLKIIKEYSKNWLINALK